MEIGNIVSILSLIGNAMGGIHKILPSRGMASRRRYIRGRKQEERHIGKTIRDLSHDELIFLFQYKRYQTTVIAFNRPDPIVQLLLRKGIIRSSKLAFDCFDAPARYKTTSFNSNCQPFELVSLANKYLIEHPKMFDKFDFESCG